ncbi:MAG: glycosyltransferase [Bacteroidales bacterium]|nr:glycosyltransferase [Bacteroidales bacterium]
MPKNSKPVICFFNSTKAWGGGEKWHYDMAVCLFEKQFSINFAANKKSELAQRLKKHNIPLTTFTIGNLSFLNIFKLLQLKRFFERKKISVVVMNLPSDIKAAGIAAKWAGVSRIVYRRGSAVPIKNSFLNRFLFKYILTDVIANSEATKNTILERNPGLFPKEKIKVIYNGLNFSETVKAGTQNFYSPLPGETVIGNVGRMVYQKGHNYLLEIASRLKSEGINFKMILGGSGPLETEIKTMAQRLGLNDRVIFTGFVDDVPWFMHNIDIFLLTSRWEGFGFVLAEAMAAAKPIVAFDISSNPELVKHGSNGFLARPFDTVEFANYLITLIKNQKLRNDFGKKGHEIVREKFSFDRVVKEFLEMVTV